MVSGEIKQQIKLFFFDGATEGGGQTSQCSLCKTLFLWKCMCQKCCAAPLLNEVANPGFSRSKVRATAHCGKQNADPTRHSTGNPPVREIILQSYFQLTQIIRYYTVRKREDSHPPHPTIPSLVKPGHVRPSPPSQHRKIILLLIYISPPFLPSPHSTSIAVSYSTPHPHLLQTPHLHISTPCCIHHHHTQVLNIISKISSCIKSLRTP